MTIPHLPDDIETMENAIVAWAAAASGIAAARVWYADQGQPRPDNTGAWLSIAQLDTDDRGGTDWETLRQNPLVLADQTALAAAVSTSTEIVTIAGHPYVTGDGPVRLTSTGGLPAGLSTGVDYWIIVASSSGIKFATSLANAIAGTPIDLSSAGTGTHRVAVTAATRRAGADVLLVRQGPRLISTTLMCLGAPAVGANRATAVLERLRAKAGLPTPRALLTAAGLGAARLGIVRPIPGVTINGARMDPRAVLEASFHATSEVSESCGSITSVQTTQTS